ncbi:MAG TPA: glycerol-3-phosphate dehydrogenase [Hyphomicrobiaceae bacterium]|nr:glycerol-3-phosphate dehydrogenase [Hyphomicrobiaceae bacterium]
MEEADLFIIGGGVNGCGIAADAAGRGLKVVLAEMADLASGTSSASSKLIHGGLRYLEHWEFRLVREALAEREVLLAKAPHIIWPLRFVLPNAPGSRHPWIIRAGLVLYDNLARRKAISSSKAIDLSRDPAGSPLKPGLDRGFAYWDCWVDDARLVVLNARAAADLGARILTRSRVVSVEADGAAWRASIESGGRTSTVRARAVVNAAGPWAGHMGGLIKAPDFGGGPHLRLIKGSHIVVPRIPGADDAYLLQAGDGRVVFVLPFEEAFSIIGTTDVPFSGDPARVAIDSGEEGYLLELASRYFRQPLAVQDIVWRYSGVRPLYDDRSDNPSAVTRDYHLELAASDRSPPLLTVLGGKVTTYRRLAEEALERLAPHLPEMGPAWTATAPLPGGDMPNADFERFLAAEARRRPAFDLAVLRRLARRHGTALPVLLGNAGSLADLGADIGYGLTEREVAYMGEREWARTAEDVLWRRTKVGLHLDEASRERAARAIERVLG